MVMVEVNNLYTCLGQSLRFPHNDILPYVNESIEILEKGHYPEEILKELRSFKKDVERLTLDELQELYSYSFEFTSETQRYKSITPEVHQASTFRRLS